MTLFTTLLRPLRRAPCSMDFAAPLVIAFKESACFLPQLFPVSHLNVFPVSKVALKSPDKWEGHSPVRGVYEPVLSDDLLACSPPAPALVGPVAGPPFAPVAAAP